MEETVTSTSIGHDSISLIEGNMYTNAEIIIEELEEQKILTSRRKDRWSKKAIGTVLTNEKYTGNVMILKSIGNRISFRKTDGHEPIISQELFDNLQEEMRRRAKRKRKA